MKIKIQDGKVFHKKDIIFIANKEDYKYFVISSLYRKELSPNSFIGLSLTEETIGGIYDVNKKIQDSIIKTTEELHKKKDSTFCPNKGVIIPKLKAKQVLNLSSSCNKSDYSIVTTIPNLGISLIDVAIFHSKDENKLFFCVRKGRNAYKGMSIKDFIFQDIPKQDLTSIDIELFNLRNSLNDDTLAIFVGKVYVFDKKQTVLMDLIKGEHNGLVSNAVFMQYVINSLSKDTEITKERLDNIQGMICSKDKETRRHALESLACIDYVKYYTLAYNILANFFSSNYRNMYSIKQSVNVRAMLNVINSLSKTTL